MKKNMETLRRALLAVLGNAGVFALAAYTVTGMFTVGPLSQVRSVIEVNLLVPWGIALGLLALERAGKGERREMVVLLALYAWLLAPFMLRFGPTGNNIATWHNHAIVFFGLYGLTAQEESARLERLLDVALALAAAVSFVFSGALLVCAALGLDSHGTPGNFGFGVYLRANLCSGTHYNTTGMLAMCGAFLCLTGAARGKSRMAKLAHGVPAVMMMLVTVLTQSRTSRYALLIGLAAGCYGMLASGRWHRRALVRHGAGVLAACVVLAGGYVTAAKLTDAALAHYARMQSGQEIALIAPAYAEAEDAQPLEKIEAVEARGLGEGTFSGRTAVWKNIFKMWKADPKYMLIGNGMGRTSREILRGTPLEDGGACQAHNTYLQFILDYGLVGFALLGVFFAMILPALWRVFFAAPGTAMAGSRMLCMLAIACMVTGMMESDPLGAMRPCNVMLFYALACAVNAGSHMARKAR